MNTVKTNKSKDKKTINFSILGLNLTIYLLVIYFIYHSLHGERGIFSYQRLSQELEIKNAELGQLMAQKATLEHHVKLISKNNLDLDMLDELSRKKLGLAAIDEMVIILKPKSELSN